MRRCLLIRSLILVVLAISASPCVAQVGDIEWCIQPDAELYLRNLTGSPIAFDGYTLVCDVDGCLDPEGWVSIGDSVAADFDRVVAELGSGALSFGEAGTPNDHQLSELNIAGQAVLQPGAPWSLGYPFQISGRELFDVRDSGELSMTFSGEGIVIGAPSCIPEPSSLALWRCWGRWAAGSLQGGRLGAELRDE